MSLNLGGVVNNVADRISNAPIIRTIISNPVFTALLITALLAIVMLSLYGSALRAQGWHKMARGAVYVTLLMSAVTFVHHYAVMTQLRRNIASEELRSTFQSIQETGNMRGTIPSYPVQNHVTWHSPPTTATYSYTPPSTSRADNVGIVEVPLPQLHSGLI